MKEFLIISSLLIVALLILRAVFARKARLKLRFAILPVLMCAFMVGCATTGAKPPAVESPSIDSPAITKPTQATTPTETVLPTETIAPTETTAPADNTTAPATEPTKQTLLGSTPTKAPITVVTSGATTAPAAKPTETPTSSQPTVAPTTQPTSPSATTLPTAKPTTPATTVPTKPTQPVTVPTTPQSSAKVLDIYGLGTAQSYTDYSYFNADSTYIWMMRAAAEEWAALNGYTLNFCGAYDYHAVAADISSRGHPDILIYGNEFPKIANTNISAPLTAAEYQKLASICGEGYLDLLNYKNASHGFVLPWSSSAVCYYNATWFEAFVLKSPKEYFLEGKWNWDTFMQCLEQTTMDLDMDGDTDVYGMPSDSWAYLVNPWATDAKGALVSTVDKPFMQDYFQLKYDAFAVKKVTIDHRNDLLTYPNSPIFSMQLSMCKTYDFQELYQYLRNGNMIEVVPVPAYNGNYIRQFEQTCASLASTCDQREGAVDLLAYMLKCGMKYMSEYSMGMIACSYEGLQGTCQRSADFLNAHNKILNDRYNKFIQQDWDQIYDSKQVAKLYQTLNSANWYIDLHCSEVTPLTEFEEIAVSKPSFAVPNVKHDYQLMLNKYNALYVY